MLFTCPVCGKGLERLERVWRCQNGHSYDIARSGYVNLLSQNGRHSKSHGDNQLMVAARRRFLDKGYYRPLSEAVCEEIVTALSGRSAPVVLDIGCGEGYYTFNLSSALKKSGVRAELFGVDISKVALDKAARRCREACFAVASAFHLPISGESCDMVVNLFAPYCGQECHRVLAADGLMLLVIPGTDHLWELKQVVYEKPYKNIVKEYELEGFHLLKQRELSFVLRLDSQEDIDSLFKMTPYYYKTSRQDQERLLRLTELETSAQFELLLYQKNSSAPQKNRLHKGGFDGGDNANQ